MAEIYTVLEAADAQGRPTGRFHHVSYSDEASEGRRIYHRLTDKEYASREEAEACPEAKAKLDVIFMRGRENRDQQLAARVRRCMDRSGSTMPENFLREVPVELLREVADRLDPRGAPPPQ